MADEINNGFCPICNAAASVQGRGVCANCAQPDVENRIVIRDEQDVILADVTLDPSWDTQAQMADLFTSLAREGYY